MHDNAHIFFVAVVFLQSDGKVPVFENKWRVKGTTENGEDGDGG